MLLVEHIISLKQNNIQFNNLSIKFRHIFENVLFRNQKTAESVDLAYHWLSHVLTKTLKTVLQTDENG